MPCKYVNYFVILCTNQTFRPCLESYDILVSCVLELNADISKIGCLTSYQVVGEKLPAEQQLITCQDLNTSAIPVVKRNVDILILLVQYRVKYRLLLVQYKLQEPSDLRGNQPSSSAFALSRHPVTQIGSGDEEDQED